VFESEGQIDRQTPVEVALDVQVAGPGAVVVLADVEVLLAG
jgi:hypothetical protein